MVLPPQLLLHQASIAACPAMRKAQASVLLRCELAKDCSLATMHRRALSSLMAGAASALKQQKGQRPPSRRDYAQCL